MLDTKYGMKYSMPHTVVHIVDNSAFNGELPVTVVDDPSLLATIVVTGAPMGEDNRIININRSDVLNVAYGMKDLTTADIEKYGQTVTYPSALIAQDVPIKFMRITPNDATYAFSCLLMQWRWDDDDHKMYVRYKTTSGNGSQGLPPGVILSNFKNVKKLNEALVKGFKSDEVVDPSILDSAGQPVVWKQRVFMTQISAGRGSEYNKFNYAINPTNQPKRPANAKYNFITINTQNTQTYESFYASLINQNNGSRLDAVDSVNVAVSKRVQGSSILVPTVNEAAIKELYAEYMGYVNDMVAADVPPAGSTVRWASEVAKLMNINIFDPLYGRYIYNGDTDVYLPYFQVDMYNIDIPKLPETNRITVAFDDPDTGHINDYLANPTALNEKINSESYGIGNDTDKIHVGDVYLTTSGTSANTGINLVTSINQYTGSITAIPISKVHSFSKDETGITVNTSEEKMIKGVVAVEYNNSAAESIATEVANLVARRKIVPTPLDGTGYDNDYVAVIFNNVYDTVNSYNIFTFARVSYTSDGKVDKNSVIYIDTDDSYKAKMYLALVYPSSSVASFATSSTDAFYNSPGATVIDPTAGTVDVNGYYRDPSTGEIAEKYSVNVEKPFLVGVLPKSAPVKSDMVGSSYDVLVYANTSISQLNWFVNGGKGVGGTGDNTGYMQNDILTVPGINTTYIIGVNPSGAGISGVANKAANDTQITPGNKATGPVYRPVTTEPVDFDPTAFYKFDSTNFEFVAGTSTDRWTVNTWYSLVDDSTITSKITAVKIEASDISVEPSPTATPTRIQRYVIAGSQGSLYRYAQDPTPIPANYYSAEYGINPNSELGGISIENGYTGFFDDNISSVEFKWRYSALLVNAYKGENGFDPRIKSPNRVPAKFLFDGATNTVVGQTLLPYMTYNVIDIINASTIFTDDEKEACVLDSSLYKNLKYEDIDVKGAMYDLMEFRCYYGMPEDKRPIGPGFGLSLHLDSGVVDGNTAMLVNQSFAKRFDNPNASWDIGGYVSTADGIAYTYTKRIVENMFRHIKNTSINDPFTGDDTNISPAEYSSYFPDVDIVDWEDREYQYKSGGNNWIIDVNGNLQRASQRTLERTSDTSDLVQESNMRTLSQLCYLLQNKINKYLLAYNDDGVLKTLKEECDNMFSNWVGDLVSTLDIAFQRDINPTDGGEIVVCYVKVTFRGLILRVPIIVDVQRRTNVES